MRSSQEPSRIIDGTPTFQYIYAGDDSSSTTASNLPGPSRVIGRLISYLGAKLERRINLFADKLGYGPLAYRRKLSKEYDSLCVVRKMTEEQQKEMVKRLMRYVKCVLNFEWSSRYLLLAVWLGLRVEHSSGTSLTRSQALELICDLILHDHGRGLKIRSDFLDAGLYAELKNLQRYCYMVQSQYQYLAHCDPDFDLLLISSRKALLFVEENEVIAAAKPFLSLNPLKIAQFEAHRDKIAFMSTLLHALETFSRYLYTGDKKYVPELTSNTILPVLTEIHF